MKPVKYRRNGRVVIYLCTKIIHGHGKTSLTKYRRL